MAEVKIKAIADFKEKLIDAQKQILSTEKYAFAKRLIGPESLCNVYTAKEMENHKLPWLDGEFVNGINIENNGNQLFIDLEKCKMEDVLMLLYYYYEQKVARENTFELRAIVQHLLEAQTLLLAVKVRNKLRNMIS